MAILILVPAVMNGVKLKPTEAPYTRWLGNRVFTNGLCNTSSESSSSDVSFEMSLLAANSDPWFWEKMHEFGRQKRIGNAVPLSHAVWKPLQLITAVIIRHLGLSIDVQRAIIIHGDFPPDVESVWKCVLEVQHLLMKVRQGRAT